MPTRAMGMNMVDRAEPDADHSRPGGAARERRPVARHCRILPRSRHGGIDVRPPRRQRRQAGRPPAARRPGHDRNGRSRARLHDQPAVASSSLRASSPAGAEDTARLNGAAAAAALSPAPLPNRCRRRPELPLLRQPPEIPAVRHHLQREVGRRPTGGHGTGQYPSAPAGAAACSTPAPATAPC